MQPEGSGDVAALGACVLMVAYALSGGVVFLCLALGLIAVWWGGQLRQRSRVSPVERRSRGQY